MRAILRRKPAFWLFGVLLTVGCSDYKADLSEERLKSMAGGELKKVVPVSGQVLVDGTPTAGVNLYLHKAEGGPAIRETRTEDEGKFCWTTHLPCDGLEPGDYLLAFKHIPKPKKNDKGVDLFKGKYANPARNGIKLTVEDGVAQDDVTFDLKTK